MDKQNTLTETPVTSADRQPPMADRSAGTLITTTSDQPSLVELSTADSITAASKSPSKPPWLNWKLLKFAALPIFILMLKPIGLGLKSIGSPPSDLATKTLTQTVDRQTMPVKISANGIVKAYRSINLSPKTAGTIKTLLVKEGDRVRQGQSLAVMDDSSLRGQLAQYQGQLLQQQANLQRLQAGNRPQEIAQAAARLQQAQATLKQRSGDWQRYQQLAQAGAISGQILEQKRADRDIAQNQVLEAQQVLALQQAGARPEQIAQAQAKVAQQSQAVALLKAGTQTEEIDRAKAKVEQQVQSVAVIKAGARKEEIAQAVAQVQAAQGSLKTIQDQINETAVAAPFDGIVLEKYADAGAFVSPSMMGGGGASASSSSILLLTSVRQQVVVNISESQIAKVKLGQAVTIKADAFPGAEFTGKVEQIAPQAKVSQNVTSVEVRVSILPTAQKLATGMNVEAQFAVGQLANALFVPNAAVVKQSQGSGVYILGQDGESVFQPIQTGMTSGKQTEVKSGLQGGEQILLSPPAEQPSGGGLKFPPAP
jgi:HlyD family secretion protein